MIDGGDFYDISPGEQLLADDLETAGSVIDELATELTLCGRVDAAMRVLNKHSIEPPPFVKREWTGRD